MLVGSRCYLCPAIVSTGVPISDGARLMRDQHTGAGIVTESGPERPRPVGMITDRDIVRARLERTADLLRLSARGYDPQSPRDRGRRKRWTACSSV